MEYINFNKNQVGKGVARSNDKQKYSIFSNIAYQPTEAEKDALLNKFDIANNWDIDHDLSNRDATVLKSNRNNDVVVAVRGTDIGSKDSRIRDLKTDIGIAFGVSKYGNRAAEVSTLTDLASKKYGSKPIMTGHSLGARIARDVAKEKKLKGVVFNMGSSPLDIWSRDSADVKHHHTRGDPISISKAILGRESLEKQDKKPGSKSAHSLKNFIEEDPAKGQVGVGVGVGKPKKNTWMKHVAAVRKKNPNTPYKECLKLASKSYRQKVGQNGGQNGGNLQGDLVRGSVDVIRTGMKLVPAGNQVMRVLNPALDEGLSQLSAWESKTPRYKSIPQKKRLANYEKKYGRYRMRQYIDPRSGQRYSKREYY